MHLSLSFPICTMGTALPPGWPIVKIKWNKVSVTTPHGTWQAPEIRLPVDSFPVYQWEIIRSWHCFRRRRREWGRGGERKRKTEVREGWRNKRREGEGEREKYWRKRKLAWSSLADELSFMPVNKMFHCTFQLKPLKGTAYHYRLFQLARQ